MDTINHHWIDPAYDFRCKSSSLSAISKVQKNYASLLCAKFCPKKIDMIWKFMGGFSTSLHGAVVITPKFNLNGSWLDPRQLQIFYLYS